MSSELSEALSGFNLPGTRVTHTRDASTRVTRALTRFCISTSSWRVAADSVLRFSSRRNAPSDSVLHFSSRRNAPLDSVLHFVSPTESCLGFGSAFCVSHRAMPWGQFCILCLLQSHALRSVLHFHKQLEGCLGLSSAFLKPTKRSRVFCKLWQRLTKLVSGLTNDMIYELCISYFFAYVYSY